MPAPHNTFKARLKMGETQIGLWLALADPTGAELVSYCGYDWLVVDSEHSPNDLQDVLAQLRAIGERSSPVVRVRENDRAIIKQMLDIGAQTILVPMIESADQAREAVRSMLYPPKGVRGMGSALARASTFGKVSDYVTSANDEICLLVQVETMAGIKALDDILSVDGLDGIFIGPADLSADMGYVGQPAAPEVQAVIDDALRRIRSGGKAAGVLTFNPDLAKTYQKMGVEFLAVGSDVTTLRTGLETLRGRFR